MFVYIKFGTNVRYTIYMYMYKYAHSLKGEYFRVRVTILIGAQFRDVGDAVDVATPRTEGGVRNEVEREQTG